MPIFNFLGLFSTEISAWEQSNLEYILKSCKNPPFWLEVPLERAGYNLIGQFGLNDDWMTPTPDFAF